MNFYIICQFTEPTCKDSAIRKNCWLDCSMSDWPDCSGTNSLKRTESQMDQALYLTCIWWNIWIKTLFDIPESRKDRTCNATWFGNQANISWQFGGQLLWSMGSIATDSICIWGSSHSSWNCNGNKYVKKIYM